MGTKFLCAVIKKKIVLQLIVVMVVNFVNILRTTEFCSLKRYIIDIDYIPVKKEEDKVTMDSWESLMSKGSIAKKATGILPPKAKKTFQEMLMAF